MTSDEQMLSEMLSSVERMAEVLAAATVDLARSEHLSLPVAFVYMRRAVAQRWPTLATIIPTTMSQMVGHDTAMALAASLKES